MFNIKEDLEDRSFEEQVEILWISGPTYHNASKIGRILHLNPETIEAMAILRSWS